jgi:hypothetical protein
MLYILHQLFICIQQCVLSNFLSFNLEKHIILASVEKSSLKQAQSTHLLKKL